jgi:hypothetical protein
MRIRLLFALSLVSLLWAGSRANADYQFVFTDSTGTAGSNFSVAAGSTVDIRVYLAQTGSDTGLSATGLNAAGAKLTFDQTVANVASTSAITPSGAWDNSFKSVGTGSASLNVTQDSGTGALKAPTTGTDANRVLIGTFTFTGVSAGNTLAVTADPHPGSDDNVLADGTVLDSLIVNSSAVITVAVPEPGTLLLTGLLACGFAGAAWSRRRGVLMAA